MKTELEIGGFGRLGGGRTRARTWDPLIKSQTISFDISGLEANFVF
jgi:hypothetical protein